MKIHHASFAALAGVLLSYGCSSKVTNNPDEGNTGGGDTATSSAAATTTASASATSTGSTSASASSGTGGSAPAMCVPTNGDVFGMTAIFYGDTDFSGAADPNAWKGYGFDIDGLVSTPQSTDLCQPAAGAAKSDIYQDGNNGIDNAFGKDILPILLGFNPMFSDQANTSIATGEFTVMIDLEALAAAADQTPVAAKLYTATPLGKDPKFDGTDCWPVAPEGLTNPADITSSTAVFPMGALTANHWDSTGVVPALNIKASVSGVIINLVIHNAHIVMDLDAAHKSATNGEIGGVLDTTEFLAEVKQVIGNINPNLCGGVEESLAMEVEQASDILSDGTQDPTKTCDGISIGLGFKAKTIQFGGVGPTTPASPNPCP